MKEAPVQPVAAVPPKSDTRKRWSEKMYVKLSVTMIAMKTEKRNTTKTAKKKASKTV